MEKLSRGKKAIIATVYGLVLNLILSVFKFLAGYLGSSSAMTADAVHSISDSLTDLVVIFSYQYSIKPEDHDHKYGHGKAETLATAVVGVVLFFTAFGLAYNGFQDIYNKVNGGTKVIPGKIALIAAVVSIVLKEALFRYTYKKGKQLNSQVMIANAWHHRSDAFSSIAALLGIGGVILLGEKWMFLDPLAAVFTAILIAKASFPIIKESVNELLDASLDEHTQKLIKNTLKEVEGVAYPHSLRSRKVGTRIALEVHIKLPGKMTLSESHEIVTRAEERIKEKFGEETIITIHVDPLKPS